MRRLAIATTALIALTALVWLGLAIAGDPQPVPPSYPNRDIKAAVDAGKHVRIAGPHGAIHVWIPAGYHADTGATIIYVHGYFDDADTAFANHQLAEQFAMAALNAMFIVPEAPNGRGIPVHYPSLAEVLRLAEQATGVTRGAALTAVIGHSGAFRTFAAWIDEPTVDHLTMIDAMYGDEEIIAGWLRASPRRRLITVGEDTLLGTESFASKFPRETFTVDRFPPAYELWPAEAYTARHLYVRAQFAHMPLVIDGIVIPSLLRLLPVESLATAAWRLPLGSLPPLPDAAADMTGD